MADAAPLPAVDPQERDRSLRPQSARRLVGAVLAEQRRMGRGYLTIPNAAGTRHCRSPETRYAMMSERADTAKRQGRPC